MSSKPLSALQKQEKKKKKALYKIDIADADLGVVKKKKWPNKIKIVELPETEKVFSDYYEFRQ